MNYGQSLKIRKVIVVMICCLVVSAITFGIWRFITREQPSSDLPQDFSQEQDTNDNTQSMNHVDTVSMGLKRDGDSVIVNTKLVNFNGGQCTIMFTSGKDSYTNDSAIVQQNSGPDSICDGFNVPISKLAPGRWDVKLTAKQGNKIGTTHSQIEV